MTNDNAISALLTALGDLHSEVGQMAWERLIKLSDRTDTNDMVIQMAIALKSGKLEKRLSICRILAKLGEKAGINEVIKSLVLTLKDDDEQLRSSACQTLGEIGENAINTALIDSLATALKDNNGLVKSRACEALGKLGDKVITDDVISGLVNALADENNGVKLSACEACGKLGEKVIVADVLDMLLTALGGENAEVRRGVCDTLGKMGEKAATDNVISELLNALEDEVADVRVSACGALGRMGEKAATYEIANKRATILSGENTNVTEGSSKNDGIKGEESITKVTADRLNMDDVTNMSGQAFATTCEMTQKDFDTIAKFSYCGKQLTLHELRTIPVENFIKLFLDTVNYAWLSVVTMAALLQGSAICVTRNSITVYGNNECLELVISNEELRQELVQAFVDQAKRLHLYTELLSKDELKLKSVEQTQAGNVLESHMVMDDSMSTTDQPSTTLGITVASMEHISTTGSLVEVPHSSESDVKQSEDEMMATQALGHDDSMDYHENRSYSLQHVQVMKDENHTNRISIQTTPLCCSDLIGLTLTNDEQCIIDEITSDEDIILKRDIIILITCLSKDSSFAKPLQEICSNLKQFDDDLDCISHFLSYKNPKDNNVIYFVVSAEKGKYIIPLIHDYRCIERIYVHDDANNGQSCIWTNNYSKIPISCSSLDEIQLQLRKDIDSMLTRPSRWTRSQELFVKLWTQELLSTEIPLVTNVERQGLKDLPIITLFSPGYQRFYLSYIGENFPVFEDIQCCSDVITNQKASSVFLIICGVRDDHLISVRSLIDERSVHAAYILIDGHKQRIPEIDQLYAGSKVSGVFKTHSDLLVQLATDICFYRHIAINTPKIHLLKANSELLAHLEKYEIDFLRYQLFIEILPELLSASNAPPDLSKFITTMDRPLVNIQVGQHIINLFKQSDLRSIITSRSSLLFNHKDILLLPSNILSSSITVYHAQLIFDDDLKMLRKKSNMLLSICSLLIASRSYPNVIRICREATDNGLTVILLEIKLFKGTDVKQIPSDSDVFVFPLGTMFQIKSIEKMSDNVWHVQAESSNFDMQNFKDQLEFKTDKNLSLSTINDYWTVLDDFEKASGFNE